MGKELYSKNSTNFPFKLGVIVETTIVGIEIVESVGTASDATIRTIMGITIDTAIRATDGIDYVIACLIAI